MSTDFRSCPGCKAMVLSDTYQCPECGYQFDEQKSQELTRSTSSADLKSASLEEECRHCGAMVRMGLVRCWNCNAFMRDDIARRYQQLSSTPQKIIYSDIPPEQRTDYLPPRVVAHAGSGKQGAVGSDHDDFTLSGGVTTADSGRAESEFDLDEDLLKSRPSVNVPGISVPELTPPKLSEAEVGAKASSTTENVPADGPDKPRATTPSTVSPSGDSKQPVAGSDEKGTAAAGASVETGAPTTKPGSSAGDGEDLLSIAMSEQQESGRRRSQMKGGRKKSGPRTQIIIPCPKCNTLVRASDEQAGRNVRCPSCKGAVPIPPIVAPASKSRRKTAKKEARPETPLIDVTWLNDAWLHVFAPTSLVLKPGSMTEPHTTVDIALTDAGMFILSYGKEAAKGAKSSPDAEGGMLAFVRDKLLGLLGRGGADVSKAADELRDQWKKVREQVESTGQFSNLPNAEVRTIDKDRLSELKLVQPIAKAHESMFAGVPVFGEGRIAIYLPLENEEGQQSFLSLPLSLFRKLDKQLKSQFSIGLPAAENGVPETDATESLSCILDQTRFEVVRNVVFYQQDPAFELEIIGHRCTSCGATISEEGRKKKKLGGANGKGLAKTKCPKCGGKMGTDPLYRLSHAPDQKASADSKPATPAKDESTADEAQPLTAEASAE